MLEIRWRLRARRFERLGYRLIAEVLTAEEMVNRVEFL
jgi:hypothetical protein